MDFRGEITNCSNYRLFLQDYYQWMKNKNPRWGYRAWARRLGLRSPSTLIMIVNGQRNPGAEVTRALIRYFRFKGRSAEFFEDLVQIEKARSNPRLQTHLLQKIKSRVGLAQMSQLTKEEFELLQNWWAYAVREMVRISGFRNDADWISKKLRFRVLPREIKKSIRSLIRIGVLRQDRSGWLVQAKGSLNTSDDIASEALKRFHGSILELARRSLREVSPSNREVSGVTLSFSQSQIRQAKDRIRRFQEEFMNEFGKGGDSVFQLEMCFFPLTQTKGDSK